MTIVKHLNHLNLNTGQKTGIEVLFADWLNVEKFVNQANRARRNLNRRSRH